VLTTIKKRPFREMTIDELLELARKDDPTDKERELLEVADFSIENYEQFKASLPDALNEGTVGLTKQELYTYYDYARQMSEPIESISITPERKVMYVCIETENIKDYLNKPFEFEIWDDYKENGDEFLDSSTGKLRPYNDVKAEITEKLIEKRAEDFEKAVEKYYNEHKDDFKRTVEGKEIIPTLEEVREEVVEKATEEELFRLSRMRAEDLPIARAAQLKHQAASKGLVLHESDFFSLDDESRIDGFLTGSEKDFREIAFAMPLGEVSNFPVRTEKGYCILGPFAERPYEEGKTEGFAKALPGTEEFWKDALSNGYAAAIAHNISSTISKKMTDDNLDFTAACKALSFEFEETDYFKKTTETLAGFEDEVGLPAMISMGLDRRDPTTNEPVDLLPLSDRTILMYRLASEKKPSEEEFLASAAEYRQRIMSGRGARAYEEWIQALAQQANIDPKDELRRDKERLEEAQKEEQAKGELN